MKMTSDYSRHSALRLMGEKGYLVSSSVEKPLVNGKFPQVRFI
jgi:hypothetical protein